MLAGQHPLAPTPVVGRVDQRSAHHTHHCVLRRWPGPGPGVQATEQSRVSRFGDLATRQDQARPAWLTPATPSEQPDDSVRDPWLDQIRSLTLPPSPTPAGVAVIFREECRSCQTTELPKDQHSKASAATRNAVATQCSPGVSP